jgi:hypothetical protein
MALEAGQTFAKPCQAIPTSLHSFRREFAVLVQAVTLTNRFLKVLKPVKLSMFNPPYFKPKTV